MITLAGANRALKGYAPWLIAAAVGAYAGVGWLGSPGTAIGEQLRGTRRRISGEPVPDTPTTRALGYAKGVRSYGAEVSSLDSLMGRERIQLPAGGPPRYVHPALPEYLRAPRSFTLPLTLQDFRPLAAMAPVVQPPAPGDPSLTAADVLAAARTARQ